MQPEFPNDHDDGFIATNDFSELLGSPIIGELLGKTKQMMWSAVQFKELQMMYACAIKEVQTKFEVLNTEFSTQYKRNPIYSIGSRLKRTTSIFQKMMKYGYEPTLENIEKHIYDVAGIRVVCSYKDDIYKIADSLIKQDDITLIARKDYIENPKPNGYRSLHLIVSVPVFFAEKKKNMNVEVQIRTIAMDFWASLEHQMKYKKEISRQEEISLKLKSCAEVIAQTDEQMLMLRRQIEMAEDIPSEEELLFEKLARLDIPIK